MKTDELLTVGLAGIALYLIVRTVKGTQSAPAYDMPAFVREILTGAKGTDPGTGWRYFDDGTAISPPNADGNVTYYHSGTPVWTGKP